MTDINSKPKAERTAAALGLFDGLHVGHRAVIARTLDRAGLAPAVFTFSNGNALPKLGEADKLLLLEGEKRSLLSDIGVKYICAPDFEAVRELSPEAFVRDIIVGRLCAGYVVCGYDFRFGKDGAGSADTLCGLCEAYGIECEALPAVEIDGRAVSSADIRALIASGDMERANTLLGREHGYTLPVIEGARLGRTIGFPTANQLIPDELICPAHGVYASTAIVDGEVYPAMTDIGVKPTVKSDGSVIMETHIFGYDGDLYGKPLNVRLRAFLRGEHKFGSLDELAGQLKKDAALCENYVS